MLGVATAPIYRRRICEFSHFRLLVLVHWEDAPSHFAGSFNGKTTPSRVIGIIGEVSWGFESPPCDKTFTLKILL